MFNLMKLAAEANRVIALRTMKLMRGGRSARREAKLMVSEKMIAASEAAASLMVGKSTDEIIHRPAACCPKCETAGWPQAGQSGTKRTRRRRK